MLQRLDHTRIGKDRVPEICAEILNGAAWKFLDGDARPATQRGDVRGRQVARHIHIPAFQQQALGGGFRHMAHDHALHICPAAPPAIIAIKRITFIGLIPRQAKGARAR